MQTAFSHCTTRHLKSSSLCRRGFWQLLSRMKLVSCTCLSASLMEPSKTGWLPWRLRMWTIKEGRATVFKEHGTQNASWDGREKTEASVCFILCWVYVRTSQLVHGMHHVGQGRKQCASACKMCSPGNAQPSG